MADSSSVDVNIITNAVDSTGSTVISAVQSNNISSTVFQATVTAGGVGPTGATGATGQGVPTGGTAGQVLSKIDATDYNTQWVAQTGGGGGTSRLITSISSNTTAGALAATDYVYLVTGTTQLTLPTAVSNSNRYSVTNVGTNTVTVATTSAQTINGSTTATLPIANMSLDFISDNANWHVE